MGAKRDMGMRGSLVRRAREGDVCLGREVSEAEESKWRIVVRKTWGRKVGQGKKMDKKRVGKM